MLLRRGANPNGLLNHKPCAIMGGAFGTEALAFSADVFDSVEVRGKVLAALLEGGADPGGFLATTIQPTAVEFGRGAHAGTATSDNYAPWNDGATWWRPWASSRAGGGLAASRRW